MGLVEGNFNQPLFTSITPDFNLMRNPVSIGGPRNPVTIRGSRNPITISGPRNPATIGGGRNPITIVSPIPVTGGPGDPPIAQYYVLSGGAGLQDGSSWDNAWANVDDVTGITGGGNVINIAAGAYDISSWQPVGGTEGSPNIYRAAQDGVHSGVVNFNSTGSQMLNGSFSNVTLDGRFAGETNFTADSSFEFLLFDGQGGNHITNTKLLGFNSESLIFCYGWGIEIAYCFLSSPLSGLDDSLITHIGDDDPEAGWGRNSIHHNVITVKRAKLLGEGWDAIKWGTNLDIYNNDFISVYDAAYDGDQHNDAIQSSGNYIRVYNNYFENFLSYCWLNEIFDDSGAAHYRIYNNIAYYSDEADVDWTAQAVFWFGGNPSTTSEASLTDLICANNTIISEAANTRGSLFCPNAPGQPPSVGADCYFVNNAANAFAPVQQVGAGVISNNINDLSVAEVTNLNLYPAGDFHPTAESIAIINAGTSPSYLTDAFTIDKDGATRVSPWDCGAYVSDFPPPTSVTETFTSLPDSSNFSDINPQGWTLHTGDFRTGSGGTAGQVTSNVVAIVSVASYEPDGFTTGANHTVEVVMGTPAGSSNAQGAACAVQSDGECYHVFTDGAGTIFFGYCNGAGAGSLYVSHAAANVERLRLVVSGTGASRVCTASYDNGSGYVTPSGWSNKDFGPGFRLDGGKGGIAGFSNSVNQYIDSVTISNN